MKFKPRFGQSVLLLALTAGLIGLGVWQLQRATQKQQLLDAIARAGDVSNLATQPTPDRYTRVSLKGRFDNRHSFLLDNQTYQGRNGVNVLTPFRTDAGTLVLVNRGWLPMSADRRLPPVPVAEGQLRVSGCLDSMEFSGHRIGPPDQPNRDQWPLLITFPSAKLFSESLGEKLFPWLIKLDASNPSGFDGRDWQPVIMTPARHRAYAVQWFGLAIVCIVVWFRLGMRTPGRPAE